MVKERNFVQLHDVARRLPDHFRGAAEDPAKPKPGPYPHSSMNTLGQLSFSEDLRMIGPVKRASLAQMTSLTKRTLRRRPASHATRGRTLSPALGYPHTDGRVNTSPNVPLVELRYR